MQRRALQIGLAVYLVLGVSGLGSVVAEAVAAEHAECCSGCEGTDCSDEGGEQCPPRCDDCACPCGLASLVVDATTSAPLSRAPHDVAFLAVEGRYDPPPARGVFRPPRFT